MDMMHWLGLDTFVYADLAVVGVLIVLEGLLSCDNAVVLAVLVKHLPPEQRGRALRYGIIGAYVFRILALLLATWIMGVWWLKVLGGLYLLWLAVKFFKDRTDANHDGLADRKVPRWFGLNPFWSTVVAVELTDIVFSVDSIAAAVALSDKLWVLILGGLLGILAMRFAAQGFVLLLERFPLIEAMAFVAVGLIGLKLAAEVPVDVLGAVRPLPAGAVYATHQEYAALARPERTYWLEVGNLLHIGRSAPAGPDQAVMERAIALAEPVLAAPLRAEKVEREYRLAHALWQRELRSLVHVNSLVASVVVLLVIAAGLLKRRPPRDLAASGSAQ
jgi:YkoY family integral membrane protein